MKVTVFGGTGYVGGYLIDELLGKGHHPVLLVRPESRHKVRHRERCTLIDGDIASPDSVGAALSGADAAIYNIGILREFPSSGVTYEALHFEGARRAMDAAEEAGARRFLLMSANGVKADGTGYQRTKYMAEQYLKTTSLVWTVFRPSVLFGKHAVEWNSPLSCTGTSCARHFRHPCSTTVCSRSMPENSACRRCTSRMLPRSSYRPWRCRRWQDRYSHCAGRCPCHGKKY